MYLKFFEALSVWIWFFKRSGKTFRILQYLCCSPSKTTDWIGKRIGVSFLAFPRKIYLTLEGLSVEACFDLAGSGDLLSDCVDDW